MQITFKGPNETEVVTDIFLRTVIIVKEERGLNRLNDRESPTSVTRQKSEVLPDDIKNYNYEIYTQKSAFFLRVYISQLTVFSHNCVFFSTREHNFRILE